MCHVPFECMQGKAEMVPFDPFATQPKMSYKDGYQKRYFVLDSFEVGEQSRESWLAVGRDDLCARAAHVLLPYLMQMLLRSCQGIAPSVASGVCACCPCLQAGLKQLQDYARTIKRL